MVESESLPHEVVECIMEKLPVKSLLRFKAVSKQWKSTIESPFFKKRQLTHSHQSGDPVLLMVSEATQEEETEHLTTLVIGSLSSVKIPTPLDNTHYNLCQSSLDGLVCLYRANRTGYVVNPTTRWYRPIPLCGLQQLMTDLRSFFKLGYRFFMLGFGKDKFMGTYKPVWLYNSLENGTTCEVYDFSTEGWRYVSPSSPCRILAGVEPVFFDGSLHWLTECQETKVVSFDLHTEAFRVLSKAPFDNAKACEVHLCSLDNRLCVSRKSQRNQVIWSFNSENKTWDKICSVDLHLTYLSCGVGSTCVLSPLALLHGDKKKKKKKEKEKKLLFYDFDNTRALVTHDLETGSNVVAFSAEPVGKPVCFFPSLISI
ncbi:unnamed protein product [Microthlaspi erraticum]|uniref:F-box domain-containing protein n=1 Tax=Microthlaspi erraticum TaxID=1685480 RepID=A0A6D2IRR0_9BRAS|nr:unnamed protein product [Microthlaspi erraticum]